VAEAKIKITADTRSAERDIRNLESALDSLKSVSNAAGIAFAAITAAGAGVAVAFKGIVDQYGDLADLGKVLDLSAQSLLNLQRSAQLAGIDAGELNQALFRLRSNLGDALVKGTGPAKDALDRLGVSVRELSTLPADQQIAKITEELRKIQNPAERSALAIDLLGKQGPRLLEVADNAARLAEQAEKIGIALSDIEVRNLEKAGDALDELSFIAKDTLTKALAQLAPYVIALVDNIKDSIEGAGGLGNIITESVIPALRIATQAAGILAAIFITGKLIGALVAVSAAVISIYNALKVATTAAAVLNAVLGKNPLLKIAGAVAGLIGAAVVVDEIGDAFDKLDAQARAISANTQTELVKEREARSKVTEEVVKLNQEQDKALKALEETISKLEQSVQFEREKVSLGETQANINKMIAEESAKLEKVGQSLTSQQRERITMAFQELQTIKDRATFDKAINDLGNERLTVAIADKNEREVALGIIKMEEQLKRSLNEIEKDSLTTAIRKTQEAREQGQIAEAIYNATRKQTELEKIQRGLSLQRSLGGVTGSGFVTSEKEYQKDQEALQTLLNNKIISEQQYFSQREELARQYNLKVQELEMNRIQTVLMAERSGMAAVLSDRDKATIQAVGQQERQRKIVNERIEFEKKSEMEKAQFGIQQAANMFSALGAQNKKAFEAAKAFNIANAIMNTYMAATKALATYPFPFGLIAAAGAVAAGFAQVAQIRAQTYSGRQLGGPVMGGTPYIVGENGPEMFVPNTTGSITRNGDLGGGQPVTVNFTIVANDTQGFDELLNTRRGVITQIISDAMLERGSRSML
jgi:hypothetical protein